DDIAATLKSAIDAGLLKILKDRPRDAASLPTIQATGDFTMPYFVFSTYEDTRVDWLFEADSLDDARRKVTEDTFEDIISDEGTRYIGSATWRRENSAPTAATRAVPPTFRQSTHTRKHGPSRTSRRS